MRGRWGRDVRKRGRGQCRTRSVVLEAVGAPTIAKSVASIGFNGQISLVGAFPSGGASFDANLFNGRFFSVQRLAVGSRTSFERLNDALTEHAIHPVIDRVFGFEEAAEAYRYLRDGGPFGKVVVTVP
ncbi:zinc-binding dehydrogenase (plasmid) [Embleya sp. NBC_00896]|nr:zinc-binding dehydrogenase [Embleya sp. NBC_00896]